MQRTHLAQHAVDPVADAQEAGLGFEVDVRRFTLDGVGQDRVDQADDRLAVFVGRGLQTAEVDLAGFDLVQDAVDRQFVAVGLVDGAVDFGFAGQERVDLDLVVRQAAHAVERDNVVDVRNGDRQPVVFGVVVERQQVVALRQFARHKVQRRGVDDRIREVDALLAKAFRERIAQRGFRDEAERHQQLADRLVRLHLFQQRDAELVLAQDALGDQDLAKLALRRGGCVHRLWRPMSIGCTAFLRLITGAVPESASGPGCGQSR